MNVLIVRAAEDARRTAARLEAAGHRAIIAPVLEIRDLDFDVSGDCDAVVATSAHAFGRPERLSALRGQPLFVVGARTAEAAQGAGLGAPRVVAANAAALAIEMLRTLRSRARVVYLAGRDRKQALEAALGPAFALAVVETYATEPVATLPGIASEALAAGDSSVLHYSHRSAAIFIELARSAGLGPQLADLRHVAISADAASPFVAAGLPVAVAAEPNEDSMIEELARLEGEPNRAGKT
ncbi:MAG: uroporphyrinogen-III synthase [Rhodoblastus sp.]|nr:uroporphyrinogen-III synthase [Rhodoblastus sp.]MCB1524562.1 uroporphyrinogen-III synthase [Rhodoblastus sp.]MCC2110391.1 uroporphyrinogen-III synthase [Hyphomicrobiales bacterium]